MTERWQFHGHDIAYARRGSGQPLLLLHNGGTDHTIWRAQLDRFAATHEVIALDLLGSGSSAKPELAYGLDLYVAQVGAFIDDHGLDGVTLVGNCMGAATALTYADAHPDRVRSVAAINILTRRTILAGALGPLVRLAERSPATGRILARCPLPRGLSDLAVGAQFARPSQVDRAVRAHLRAQYGSASQSRVLISLAANMASFAPVEDVPIGVVPTVIAWGRSNRVLPLRAGRALAQRSPMVPFVELPGGHLPMLEHPRAVDDVIAMATREVVG